MKTMKKYLTLAAVTVLALTCLTGCGKKIDVLSGMEVEFSGVDGKGRAEVVFPDAELGYGFLDDLVLGGKEEFESFADLTRLDKIANAVTYEVTPDQDLSNGDKVTVEITVNSKTLKDLGYSAKSTSKTFKVEGLAEPVEIDPFKDFEVTFSGISPLATAEFDAVRELEGTTVRYTCENNGHLRLGEPAVITASVNNQDLYILKKETKEFTVKNVDAYISDAADIPDALWAEAKKQAEKGWENRSYNDYMLWDFKDFEYVGYEFWTCKEGNDWKSSNNLHLIYKVTVNDGEEDFSFYFDYLFENLLQRMDGTWDMKYQDLQYSAGNFGRFQHNIVWVHGDENLRDMQAASLEKYGDHYTLQSDLK